MMASVSRAERDKRERVRLRARRTSQGATSARVTSRYPPPTSMIMRALSSASSRALTRVTSARASSADPSSSTSRMRSSSTGISEANRRASTMSMGSVIRGTSSSRLSAPGGDDGRVGGWALDDDLAEELGLVRARLSQAYQLEQGEERHHPLRAHALLPGHRREEDGPGIAQELQDLSHALEDGQRVRLDLAGRPSLLFLDEPRDGPLEEMHGEILERDVFSGWQLGHRAAVEQRLLRLALAEPGPEGLDPRVLAQPRGQLLAQELAFFIELVGRSVGVGGQEQLRLEVDQGRGHDHEGPGRLQILELHGLEVRQVLLGDGADGQVGEVDLIGPAQVKQEVEGADKGLDPDRQALRLRRGVDVCRHLVTGAQKWPPYSPTHVFIGRRGAQKWPPYSPTHVFIGRRGAQKWPPYSPTHVFTRVFIAAP